jgi:hypothetical protein
MALLGLGYAGFGSAELDEWRDFGTGLVGLQAVERGNSLLAFRMDDRKQRIVIDRTAAEGSRFFGWEVADDKTLDALAARLECGWGGREIDPATWKAYEMQDGPSLWGHDRARSPARCGCAWRRKESARRCR